MRFPTIELSTGETVQVTYPRYRALLATNRVQADRARAFEAHHGAFEASLNTYAALYNGVLQRDWYQARARGYASTLEAALHGDNIPVAVVENLIASARANISAFQRYEKLRRRALKLETYHLYDGSIPLVDFTEHYPYQQVVEWIVASVAPLGRQYQERLADGFERRWVDIYENDGKRSGAYSAPVYGVHPYVLMNYNDTLDAAFTLAHEMGHSMHTVLSHERQPFVYSDYTIFVAEVPSTLSEALLLDYRLAHATDPARAHRAAAARHRRHHRHVLHAGDVCRLGTAGASPRRGGRAGHRRRPQCAVRHDAAGLPRRRHRLRLAVAGDLGPHPAFLRLAVLCLSVRDLLRVERPLAGRVARCRRGHPGRDHRALSGPARGRWKRLPDGAAAARRNRPRGPLDGRRRRRPCSTRSWTSSRKPSGPAGFSESRPCCASLSSSSRGRAGRSATA